MFRSATWLAVATSIGCVSAVSVAERTLDADGGTVAIGDIVVSVPAGALDAETTVRVRSRGDQGTPDARSDLWALEPIGTPLLRPASVSFPDDPSITSVVAVVPGGPVTLPVTRVDGRVVATIDTLALVYASAAVITPVTPTPPTNTPPPPSPATPAIVTGSWSTPTVVAGGPQPGQDWSCGTGTTDDVDLAGFDDTAVAVASAVQCPAGVEAYLDGVSYALLGGALAAAPAGAVVEACPGVHIGPYGSIADAITVRGMAPDARATVLTGRLDGRVLSGIDLVLENLTIRRGYADYEGGGVEAGGLEATNVVFNQNLACYGGGGVSSNGQSRVVDSRFEDNVAGYDGAGAKLTRRWSPGDIRVEGTTLEGNTAGYSGGGLVVDADGGTVAIASSTFRDNTAGYGAGGLASGSWDPFRLEVTDTLFEGNHAGYEGGAATLATWSPADDVWVSGSTFRNNTSAHSGDAVSMDHWEGGDYRFDDVLFQGGTCGIHASSRGSAMRVHLTATTGLGTTLICPNTDATLIYPTP